MGRKRPHAVVEQQSSPQPQPHEASKKRRSEPPAQAQGDGDALKAQQTTAEAADPFADSAEISETLYVKNLNDQVSIKDLKVSLYMLFSEFGHVVAINAHASRRMRGQAHIAFGNKDAAERALVALRGQQFLDKELRIEYAKQKSNRLVWLQRDLEAADAARVD